MIAELLFDALKGAVLVTGLVVVMMMMIESFNISTSGKAFAGLRRSRVGQVAFSALLGSIPGCMGGFASVSLYTHGMISFGALVAMMIASSGDEAFVMLAMFPQKAWWIFLLLFVVAVAAGLLVDLLRVRRGKALDPGVCEEGLEVHSEDEHHHRHGGQASQGDASSASSGYEHGCRHFSWKRLVMFIGVVAFIAALVCGVLEHEHAAEAVHGHEHAALAADACCHDACCHDAASASAEQGNAGINLLSEDWMNVLFAVLSLIVLGVIVWGSDHFVNEHLWHHVICKHLPRIFAWTFGVLIVLGVLTEVFDVSAWISNNTVLMILLATAIGIIPESGPHLIFVTLFASGIVPLPVLLASSISQDGHASLPLLAESKKDFLKAKAVNCLVALLVGFAAMLI